MRISDWSSDVCSSDLLAALRLEADAIIESRLLGEQLEQRGHAAVTRPIEVGDRARAPIARRRMRALREAVADEEDGFRRRLGLGRWRGGFTMRGGAGDRSDEHTSELQSLMRISYAVFCLKNN